MICTNCNAEFDGDTCPECGAAVTTATDALIRAASALLQEGLPDQAIEALEQALARDPKSYEAHSLLGAAYMRKQEFELAGHHFERAVWLDSGRAAARYNLALAYRAAGRLDEAVQQLRAALSKDPSHEKSRALLRELERIAAGGEAAPEPGSPENRARAAAPHLQPVSLPGERLSHRLSHRAQVGLGTFSALAALILGAFTFRWAFHLLTSPQLVGRDAELWSQLPYAIGGMVFFSVVIAASFQARGAPVAGALAGLIGVPLAVAIILGAEREPVTAGIIAAAALGGALGVGLVEAAAKFTRLGEFRRFLIWVSLAAFAGYVIVGFVRQGSLSGYVTRSIPDNLGQPVITRIPDAQIVLRDPHTGRTYTTVSRNAQASGGRASAHGSYRLRGIPVGRYHLRCVEPATGAFWEGEVYVDYAVVGGSQMEIPLLLPLEDVTFDPHLRK